MITRGGRAGGRLRTQVGDQSLHIIVAHVPVTTRWHNQQGTAILVDTFPDSANDFSIAPILDIARRGEVGSIKCAERRHFKLDTEVRAGERQLDAGRMTACAGVRQLLTTRNLRRGSGDPNVFNRIVEVRVQLSKTNRGENQQGSGDQGQQSRE